MSNFYENVIKPYRLFHSRFRCDDLNLLHPTMRRKVRAIISDAAGHGIKLMVFETFRSKERQLELYQQGVTKLKEVGVHHYGLAADIVFADPTGQPSWKGDFSFLGRLAKAHNVIWGGDWDDNPKTPNKFQDEDHIQLIAVNQQTDLFAGKWYPDDEWERH